MARVATGLDLQPRFALCAQCTLSQCPIVPGNGPEQADLVIVGEAPGETEVAKGRGFVGRSGILLDKALRVVGIDRSKVAFSNAVLCRPPDNRPPTRQEIEACNERLLAEVQAYRPRLVLALGGVAYGALKGVAGKAAVGAQRGILQSWAPPFWATEERGKKTVKTVRVRREGETTDVKLLASWHPAFVLRKPEIYSELERDLRLAADYLNDRIETPDHNINFIEVSDPLELRRLLTGDYASRGVVSLDIETGGSGELLCVGLLPVDRLDLPVLVATGEALGETRLWSWYLRRCKPMGHNLKFDVQGLWKHGIDCAVGADTLLLHYAMDEKASGACEDGSEFTGVKRGLKVLAQQMLYVPDWSKPVEPYMKSNSLQNCPKETLLPYNARDVLYTAKMYRLLMPNADGKALNVLNNFLLPGSNVLARMEYIGIRIDRASIETLREQLSSDVAEADAEMRQICAPEIERIEAQLNAKRSPRSKLPPKEFNHGSWQQIHKLLYKEIGLPKPQGTKSESATDAAVLEALQELPTENAPESWARGLRFIEKLLELRHTQKLLGTYVEALGEMADENDRIHGTFHLHTTVTGRLSSSNPNLQNQPKRRGKEIRNLFIPSEGYVFVEADLSQAELRTVAGFSHDPNLLAAIHSGTDLHRGVASMLYKCKPEEVTSLQRSMAKNSNFAFLYGAEAKKIAQVAKIPLAEAQDVLDRLHNAFPVAMAWLNDVRKTVLRTGVVETPYGRRRRWDFIPPSGKERAEILRAAGNMPVQSVASDITLGALIRIAKVIDWNRTRLLITVHDAIMVETVEDPIEVARFLTREMVRVTPFPDVPFAAEASVGDRWGSMKEVAV